MRKEQAMATMTDLRGKNFLKLADYSPEEITYLIDLAAELKATKKEGREVEKLVGKDLALIFEKEGRENHRRCGKTIALIFEKAATGARCAIKGGAYDQGAHVTFLGPAGSH